MKWSVLGKGDDVIEILLKNRQITNQKEFLDPKFPEFKLSFGKAMARIKKAIKNEEKIIVYGDYDADGICATAIMWETLRDMGAQVMPFIPSREKEGYGLSIEGMENLDTTLIVTVDSGIMAHEAVDYANSKKIDVIIIDHHQKPKKLPKAYAIIHTTKLCSAGIAYFFAKELLCHSGEPKATPESDSGRAEFIPPKAGLARMTTEPFLELAAIATITDLLPLVGINRSIVKFGLKELVNTKRIGLRALFDVAGIEKIGTYEIGYMIGPRLNASGRIESALTALRLLCTNSRDKAEEYARLLNETNKERQAMTWEMATHAISQADTSGKIIVLEHESYHQGIIGLVAGKLVDEFHLPAIVIARSEEVSKASARSVSGFDIIEAIRSCESLLLNAGGHPMAAGFTIETAKIESFKIQIAKYANKKITKEMLEKTLKIDMKLPLEILDLDLYHRLQQLSPFGMGNPEPVFESFGIIKNIRAVGAEGKHLKLIIENLEAIFFNGGAWLSRLKVGQEISLAYSLSLNEFNGHKNLQLRIRDIKPGQVQS